MKIQYHEDGKSLWQYYLADAHCSCGCNCFHKGYDGKIIHCICNACDRDIGTIKPEYTGRELSEGIWIDIKEVN